jgi:hypothetical protein
MTAGEFEISSLGKGRMASPLKGIDFFKAGEMRNFNPIPNFVRPQFRPQFTYLLKVLSA